MVRKAVMDDFPVILNIYATARAFMAKTGNPTQWADGHPSADLLRECILAQKLFVFTDPDDFSQIRGCFYFAIENDPTYAQISEGSWLSDAPYGVIHMVASDGQVHGFLRNVLDFCEPQTSLRYLQTRSQPVSLLLSDTDLLKDSAFHPERLRYRHSGQSYRTDNLRTLLPPLLKN